MKSNVIFLMVMLIASVTVMLDGFVFNVVIEDPVNVFSFEEASFADLAVVHSMMIGLLCVIGLVIFYAEHVQAKARMNPLVIEVYKNTLIGKYSDQKDVLIGVPFSSDQGLVANTDMLVKGINQILKVAKKEKRSSKAHFFVELHPKITENGVFLDQDEASLREAIERSEFRGGSVFSI